MAILLLGLALLSLGGIRPAQAQSTNCVGTFFGVVDGNVTPVPSNLQVDGTCTIENYPKRNPYGGNITWAAISNTLLVFNNVDFTGNLSCDALEHNDFVWFTNGSITRGHIYKCANLFAPVDKIDKAILGGQTTATIGVPFTYTLTFPQLYDPLTGTVTNPNGSDQPVSGVTITDNLNATGVSLSYVSSSAAWKGGAAVPVTVANAGGVLTFSGFPRIPAGQQIVLTVTVVLNNTVPPNTPGTSFVNTANWTLSTVVGGIPHTNLPGQAGVSPPLTIATPPKLTLTKGGPATMNLGQLGQFALNLQNTGNTDAWNATIVDKLPSGATGGMCANPPQILSAQVFQADGVTAVPGKGPLTAGPDYTVSFAGAPACTLTLNMLSAAAVLGPGQRLIVTYQTQLDPSTPTGATLTNIAGATQWYSGPGSVATRQSYACPLTNGTPGVLDCQDAHTVTVALSAVTITKQVTVAGAGPPVPGATLNYLVHVTNTSTKPVNPVVITDNLNAAGPGALTYVGGTATMNGSPNGVSVAGNVMTANYSATYGALAPGGTIDLRFSATLGSTLAVGTTVTNTGVVTWNNPAQTASGSVSIQVVAPTAPALTLIKGGPATMNLGQAGQFSLNVQNAGMIEAWNATIVDKLPTGATGGMCATPPRILSAQVFQADGVTPVPGKGPLVAGTDYTVAFAGPPSCTLTLNLLSAAAVIGTTQRLIVTYQTQLDANTQKGVSLTNVAGATQWYNAPSGSTGRLSYSCALSNGTPGVLDCQDAHTVTVPISAVTLTKGGPATMYLGQLGQFTLNVQNTGTTDAWNATLVDRLPTGATGGMCTTTPQLLSAQVFQANGVTPAAGKGALKAGTDYTVAFAGAPACTLTLNLLSAAAVISPTQRLIITYQTQLDANSHIGATLTNVAGATQWYDGPSSATGRQSATCTLTNGTPGMLDCQDAHTVTVTSSAVTITKQVTVVGGGTAAPGGTLDYLVRVTNASANPVSPVLITDDLNAAGAGALAYVAGTATMNGSVTGVTVTGNVLTANYSATFGPLPPGGTIDLRFRATLGKTLATGAIVTNTGVVTWNNPPQTASASVSIQLDTPVGALTVSKTTPLLDVSRGQLVPYTITVTNVLAGPVSGVALVDNFPAGFSYVKGSARIDDTPAEPTVFGGQLTWSNLSFAGGAHHTVVLLLAVGAGVGEGQFVNRAQAFTEVAAAPAATQARASAAATRGAAAGSRGALSRAAVPPPPPVLGNPVSTEASATVVVTPDTTFDCTDVLGKVFDDVNGNGRQDPAEKGIPGVRVLTTRGLAAITDEFGRFHITCAITPLEGRGSNFALKLDDRTLPSGYRLTTPQVVVERATRGKALRFEFGASIHRVVSLDLSDAVFEPGTAEMRPQWRPRLDLLLAELRKSRSILHLSYLADVEEQHLVERRLAAVDQMIQDGWRALNCCYELTIEREVYWLRGSPPSAPVERVRGAK
jgi:uncharacterized repeat protein (TIGR01451 family)/fimbrial isopeptide formation D2 family protein